MKLRFFVLLLCLGLATPALAQSNLTNADVLKMVEGKVPQPFVVATIERAAEANFDLGPDALVELKKRGVPDGIIEAMMKKMLAASPASASSAPAASASAEPAGEWASRQGGVYLERAGANGKEVVRLTDAVISKVDVGGGLANSLSFGVKKLSVKHGVVGAAAPTRAPADQLTLYIARMNPRSLVLLKASKKGRGREFKSGEIGGFTSVGIEAAKGDFEFTTEEVSPGVHRVILTQPLTPGEYGFGVVGPGGLGPIYEFGIDR